MLWIINQSINAVERWTTSIAWPAAEWLLRSQISFQTGSIVCNLNSQFVVHWADKSLSRHIGDAPVKIGLDHHENRSGWVMSSQSVISTLQMRVRVCKGEREFIMSNSRATALLYVCALHIGAWPWWIVAILWYQQICLFALIRTLRSETC